MKKQNLIYHLTKHNSKYNILQMENKIKSLCQSFLNHALKEIKKYENNLIKREEMAWNIVNLAIELGLFELISQDKLTKDIVEIVNLACDLEVPDEAYRGTLQKDFERFVSLIKKKTVKK